MRASGRMMVREGLKGPDTPGTSFHPADDLYSNYDQTTRCRAFWVPPGPRLYGIFVSIPSRPHERGAPEASPNVHHMLALLEPVMDLCLNPGL